MALKYFKYQNRNSHNAKSYHKWYGRVIWDETVEIDAIADEMQENCTVKRADILAVLSELGPTMKKLMENSNRVKLPYLGTFKYGISCEGAESESDFTAANIKKVRVLFQPITQRVLGKQVQEMTANVRLKEHTNIDPAEEGQNSGGGSDPGTVQPDNG